MICVRLLGGLGNQLFQYAAGRALAAKHRTDLLLDTSHLEQHKGGETKRQFELHRYAICARPTTCRDNWRLRVASRRSMQISFRLARSLTGWTIFKERVSDYDPHFERLPDRTFLIGYWQSYRYFSTIDRELRSELRPCSALSGQSQEVLGKVEANNAAAVHVRRGDYVSREAAARYHGVLPLAYYEQAIARVREASSGAHFFVFSDDPVWCSAHLPFAAGDATFVTHNPSERAWEDLVLMSRCRHHIIANSSFSWWGAWLAALPRTGITIVPKRWFVKDQRIRDDRFPDTWKITAL